MKKYIVLGNVHPLKPQNYYMYVMVILQFVKASYA
jgi:hypothetical protein